MDAKYVALLASIKDRGIRQLMTEMIKDFEAYKAAQPPPEKHTDLPGWMGHKIAD